MRTLCQDWFPIDYPFSWYEDITSSTRFFALAAVYNLTIIGLIVAEIKPYARLNKEVTTIIQHRNQFVLQLFRNNVNIFSISQRIVTFFPNRWVKNVMLPIFYR